MSEVRCIDSSIGRDPRGGLSAPPAKPLKETCVSVATKGRLF